MTIVLIVLVALMVSCVILMFRNEVVFKESMRMHDLIFQQDNKGNYVHSLKEINDLLEEEERVMSYNKMVYTFWINVGSFKFRSPTLTKLYKKKVITQ